MEDQPCQRSGYPGGVGYLYLESEARLLVVNPNMDVAVRVMACVCRRLDDVGCAK